MYLFFDESGDFTLPQGIRKVSLIASLICPDSHLCALEDYFKFILKDVPFPEEEIKGDNLPYSIRLRLCHFIGQSNHYKITVIFVDSSITSKRQLDSFRIESARLADHHKSKYLAKGSPDPNVIREFDKVIKQHLLPTRFSDSEYLQWLLSYNNFRDTLQHSIAFYLDYSLAEDFNEYHFIYDKKGPKLTMLEKWIKHNLSSIIDRSSKLNLIDPLLVPTTWRNNHPFVQKYGTTNGIDLTRLFKNTVVFDESSFHIGLQLIHIISNTIYRHLTDLNEDNLRCFRLIRNSLCAKGGNDFNGFLIDNCKPGDVFASLNPNYEEGTSNT